MRSLSVRDRRPRLVAALSLTAALLAPVAASAETQGQADPKAAELAARVVSALGGQSAWDDLHWVRFRFAGFRNHWWDKHTGRHRVEFTNRSDEHWVVLQDLDTREGQAFKDGKKLEGEEAKKAIEAAYGTWINDTYWLFVPFKLRDPGVILSDAGASTIDGVAYDRLHLRFQQVGLTPGDQYWLFVNPETGLIDRWSYRLQDFASDRPEVVWKWSGWQQHGPLKLAGMRQTLDGERSLPLDEIELDVAIPDSVFTSGEPLVAKPATP